MFHLIQKNHNNGGNGKQFLSAEYSTFLDAEKAACDQLQNVNILEITIVEAKARVQRTMNVEVTKF